MWKEPSSSWSQDWCGLDRRGGRDWLQPCFLRGTALKLQHGEEHEQKSGQVHRPHSVRPVRPKAIPLHKDQPSSTMVLFMLKIVFHWSSAFFQPKEGRMNNVMDNLRCYPLLSFLRHNWSSSSIHLRAFRCDGGNLSIIHECLPQEGALSRT